MNRRTSFFVPGLPQPQPRPRMTKRGHTYNPPTADAWKAAVREAWSLTSSEPYAGAVRMRMVFFLPRPAGHFRKSGDLVKGAPSDPIGRPDIDNLAKAVMDALGDVQAFRNDAAVISLAASKTYPMGPNVSGCEITITQRD